MNKKRYNIFNKHSNVEGTFNSLKAACEWGGLNYNSVRVAMSKNKKKVFENQVYILTPEK